MIRSSTLLGRGPSGGLILDLCLGRGWVSAPDSQKASLLRNGANRLTEALEPSQAVTKRSGQAQFAVVTPWRHSFSLKLPTPQVGLAVR